MQQHPFVGVPLAFPLFSSITMVATTFFQFLFDHFGIPLQYGTQCSCPACPPLYNCGSNFIDNASKYFEFFQFIEQTFKIFRPRLTLLTLLTCRGHLRHCMNAIMTKTFSKISKKPKNLEVENFKNVNSGLKTHNNIGAYIF